MAVQKVMNIVATTGTYQKDGQEKKKYLTVGALFIYEDGGMSIKLEAMPTNFDGSLSVYERDNNQGQQNNQGQNAPQQQQGYQQPQQQQQSYQQPPMQQEFINAQGQKVDVNGNLIQ
jgi:hypothetical protein